MLARLFCVLVANDTAYKKRTQTAKDMRICVRRNHVCCSPSGNRTRI